MKHEHISYEEIENFVNANEESVSQNDLISFEEFDHRLDNCEVCRELFRAYTSLSAITDVELSEDDFLEDYIPAYSDVIKGVIVQSHEHITLEEIESYVNANEESFSQNDLISFEEFDHRLDNCEVCRELFRAYISLSIMIESEPEEVLPMLPLSKIKLVQTDRQPRRTIYRNLNKKIIICAAASTSEGFAPYFSNMTLEHDGICGKLEFWGNHQREVYLIFRFDVPQKHMPFGLEFCFTTKSDGEKYTITITTDEGVINEDNEDRIISIESLTRSGINYSDGIEGDYTLSVI